MSYKRTIKQVSKTKTMEGETLQSDDKEPDDLSPAIDTIRHGYET